MKVKEYMDCFYEECQELDTINEIKKYIQSKSTDYFVVVDSKGFYKGILRAIDVLLKTDTNGLVKELIQKPYSVNENTDIRNIKNYNFDILPVVNMDNYPVGIIRLKHAFPILNSIKEVNNTGKKFIRKSLNAKYTIDHIIGNSDVILKLKESIIRAAKIKSTILLQGETGVGKELVAQSIVNLSERRFKPFVRINCASIPENLLESELFGYEEGSYTGAAKGGGIGKFEIADGGTIFLDEIGDMQMFMQAKILRVLQEKEVERIGGKYPIPVDVRVIAATHAALNDMVEEGTFRKDLYYRLNVVPIHIPPLREHLDDIELLVKYYANRFLDEMGVSTLSIEAGVFGILKSYHWPGNIRELKNVIEMLIAMTNGDITKNSVDKILNNSLTVNIEESILKSNASEAERDTIIKYLKIHVGNKNKVAEILGISRSSLYNKLRKYGING